MNNIGESNKRVLSALITCAIAGLLIFSGPSSAINVSMNVVGGPYSVGDTVTLTSTITINSGELIPITSRVLTLTKPGSGTTTCSLSESNGVVTCADGTNITVAVSKADSWQYQTGTRSGYGYGYDTINGYGYATTNWDYGYGYGYGYGGYNYIYAASTTLTYTITFIATSSGTYTSQVSVVASDGSTNRTYLSDTAQFTVTSENILITEIMANPVGDDQGTLGLPLDGQWVEIYNNGTSSVNVTGWLIKDLTGSAWTISSANSQGTVNMAAGNFLVVYRNGEPMGLNQSVGIVNLTKADGTQVDVYSYNISELTGGANTSAPEGSSISRSLSTGSWSVDSTPSPMADENATGSPPLPTIVMGYVNYTSGHPDNNVVISLLNTQAGSNGSGAQAVINTTSGKCMYTPANSYGVNNSCNYSSDTGFFQIELYGTNAENNDSINVTATDKYNKTNTTTTNLANNISAGNVTTDIGTIMLETSEITQNISLVTGWNLISFPVDMAGETASTVLDATTNCTMIAQYTSGVFDSYSTLGGGTDFAISNASGYFVYCPANDSIAVTDMPLSAVNKTMLIGWNLVGWISSTNNSTASSVLTSIQNSTMIAQYTSGVFDSYSTLGGGTNFVVSAGNGYFVYTSANTSWYQA